MIKNIVFDMGGVLKYFLPQEYIRRLGISGQDQEILLREVFHSVEWVRLDRGNISEEEAAESMSRRVPDHLHPAVRELVCSWWKGPIIPVEGMEELIRELKDEGYGIYLLSNAGKSLPQYFDRIPGSQYFDGRVISAYWGVIKPQQEIYRILLDTYHLKAEECFFVDDLPINVEGACYAGFSGAIFDGDMQRLRRELKESGVWSPGWEAGTPVPKAPEQEKA